MSLLGTSRDGKTLNLCVAPWLLISFSLTWSKNSKQRSRGIRTFNHVSCSTHKIVQAMTARFGGQKSELLDLNEAVRYCHCKVKSPTRLTIPQHLQRSIYWILKAAKLQKYRHASSQQQAVEHRSCSSFV